MAVVALKNMDFNETIKESFKHLYSVNHVKIVYKMTLTLSCINYDILSQDLYLQCFHSSLGMRKNNRTFL